MAARRTRKLSDAQADEVRERHARGERQADLAREYGVSKWVTWAVIHNYHTTGDTLFERFWAKVNKSGECWEWTAYRDPKGYGHINVGGRPGRPELAHRVAWTLLNGPVPDGLFVCHRCDNPPCVNPAHLFLGTNDDNMRDCASKGRRKWAVRFTGDQVAEIRRRHAQGEPYRALAESFGMSPRHAYSLCTGRRGVYSATT